MVVDRRNVCALLIGMLAAVQDGFEDAGLVVHWRLPLRSPAYRVGEVLHDAGCGRYFRISKIIRTPTGVLAKTRWIRRAA